MKKQYNINLLFSLLISLVFFACTGREELKTESQNEEMLPDDIVEMRDDQIKLADIQTGSIELRALSQTIKVNGIVTTSPQDIASVCMPMGGFVKSTSLFVGDAVTKGQTMAIVTNQDFIDIQQNYLEAKNKLEYAEAEYNRHTELYKDDVYSQKNVQQVTSDYKNLKAQVKALEQKLALIGINPSTLKEENISGETSVVAPISGYIKSANINIGKHLAPSDILFEVINSNHLLLELTLFEKDADKVIDGQKIRFFINNEDEQHNAIIKKTGRSIGTDRTLKVYASVEELCKNVLPGMYVNAFIETSSNSGVTAVPSDAIVSFDEKEYIFVFEKNKEEDGKPFTEYKMIQITKGATDNGFTEIQLPEGFNYKKAKVVVKGAYNLLSAKKNAGEMAC